MRFGALVGVVLLLLGSIPSVADVGGALDQAGANRAELEAFVAHAADAHGDFGQRAAEFLVRYMPEKDRQSLSAAFLNENLDFALRARAEFPWAQKVSEAMFFNNVLPYASLDESRERWRPGLYEKAKAIVADAETATEAVQAINRELFNVINVHYNTGRKRPNQSPDESIQQGRATCTGLSIILVDACRAVGIPARITGTPLWTNNRGNHTWTEIWDGGWHFTGSDEYDAKGLDRGWFVGAAGKADRTQARYSIYSSSWKPADTHFPMVWARGDESVPAYNVTDRYAVAGKEGADAHELMVRVRDTQGGERLAVKAELLDADNQVVTGVMTKAGRADLNDIAALTCRPNASFWLRLSHGDEEKRIPIARQADGPVTLDLVWAALPSSAASESDPVAAIKAWLAVPEAVRPELPAGAAEGWSVEQAERVVTMVWQDLVAQERKARAQELKDQVIRLGDHELKFKERVFGEAPDAGHSLWISMHGGGGAPPAVNDRQWENQIRLYEPEEGIYVAPRAPTDTWNLWHQAHIDALFQRLIEDYVIARGVDPNRVYVMGYSAGGDGVYQLGPRMADRWAAAAMMAGHPNETKPISLRNLPFALFMGGEDKAYKRNEVAASWGESLGQLRNQDPDGYPHWVQIYPGKGHWMEREDREALPWMQKYSRNVWPSRIEWLQDDVVHERFYWLEVSREAIADRQRITAEVNGQSVTIEADGVTSVALRLRDGLIDLDQPIRVMANGEQVFSGKVPRSFAAIRRSLEQRAEPSSVATAYLPLSW